MRPTIRAALITSMVALASCGGGSPPPTAGASTAPLAVSTLEASVRRVPITVSAVGRTEGSREVQIRARVSGIIEKQLYAEGDTVKAGAPLFRIERAPFEIDLQQQRAALAQEMARSELAQQEYERLKGLADRRAISQREADQAASALRQSAATVQLAQARVKQSELNLSYTQVDAPITGTTGRALQSVGSLVTANAESSLLTTLTRTDPIWVRFALSEAEFAQLRTIEKGATVKLETANGKEFPVSGRLNFSGSTVDATLGTVQMRAEFANPRLALLPGQFVRVKVAAGEQQAIVLPQAAVLQNESGRFVWIVADGKAAQRNIRAGTWSGNDWVVLDGLKPGEAVIVDNLARLKVGAPVSAKKAG